jgi:uncharacterized protein (TIGR02284 family)
MDDEIGDGLMSLHTRAVDARRGYEEALSHADGNGMAPLFVDMIAIHTTNANELSAQLDALGEHPDPGGSFMGAVHSSIMDVRSLFGGLDESVLPGLIDGEERNVERYNRVLSLRDIPIGLRDDLDRQRQRIQAMIATMKATTPR